MNTSQIGHEAELVRLERDSFVLLQHVYAMSEGRPGVRLSASQTIDDLAFAAERGSLLLDHLIGAGCLAGSAPVVCITREGVEYIERLAWRRRSVRVHGPEGPP